MGVVATWLHMDAPEQRSHYFQVQGDSSTADFQAVYWRCVVTFFESSLRINPGWAHVLVTNSYAPPVLNGLDIDAWLRERGVEVKEAPFTHALPGTQPHAWANQFYVFDALRALVDSGEDAEEPLLLMDSDVFWRGRAEVLTPTRGRGAATYRLDYPEDVPINGLSRAEATEIAHRYGVPGTVRVLTYSGGEVISVRREYGARLLEWIHSIYDSFQQDYAAGRKTFTEEAHLLSAAYELLGAEVGALNGGFKRIWTDPRVFRGVEEGDEHLAVWHLPAEKERGLRRIFKQVAAGRAPHDRDAWMQLAEREFGVPRYGIKKRLRELPADWGRALRGIARRAVRIPRPRRR